MLQGGWQKRGSCAWSAGSRGGPPLWVAAAPLAPRRSAPPPLPPMRQTRVKTSPTRSPTRFVKMLL